MQSLRRRQRGVVLVIALVLMVAMLLVALSTMRSTTTELKIITNLSIRHRAFQFSEEARLLAGDVVDEHTAARSWDTSQVSLPTGFSVPDANNFLYVGNNASLGVLTDAARDLLYASSIDNNGKADLFVTRLHTNLATGAGTAVGEGYSGLGVGSAGGGGLMFYDIRSVGHHVNNARAVTGSDFQHVIRN